MIQVGDYVIINEVDCPCARLVAEVTEVRPIRDIIDLEQYQVKAKYLSGNTSMFECSAGLSRVTKVTDFGVDIVIGDDHFICTRSRDSVATYEDGQIRQWQDNRTIAREPLRRNRREGDRKC